MIARSGGVIVAVRGARQRAVPVLARYHAPLLAAAAFAGVGLVTGGAGTARKNVTARLNSSPAGGGGLPRLDTSRLRATWLRDAADLLGLATFMAAAGISRSQRLGDLVAGLRWNEDSEWIYAGRWHHDHDGNDSDRAKCVDRVDGRRGPSAFTQALTRTPVAGSRAGNPATCCPGGCRPPVRRPRARRLGWHGRWHRALRLRRWRGRRCRAGL